MKYLKSYNESQSTIDSIKNLCDNYLPFLSDYGFTFNVYKNVNVTDICISISRSNNIQNSWSEISDDFLPFLELLDKGYKIKEGRLFLTNYFNNDIEVVSGTGSNLYKPLRISIDDIVNLREDSKFRSILIMIEES